MREIRSYGSVRGVAGDRYPYRDPHHDFSRPPAPGPGHPAPGPGDPRQVRVLRMAPASKLASLCAGINRHDVKNERVLQERSSDPS
jgi:hypothetical protein